MYEQFFGLNRSPFKITPDTSLFYDGGRRGDVLGALVYAVQRGEGIVKVVGEVGSGKTMLCRMLQQELPKTVEIVYIANPSVSPDDILFVIAHELQLDVAKDASKHEVMHLLQAHLLKRYTSEQQVVLFVEEAQGMPLETLEEIRLLSNLETDQEKLLQIILFGQPELDENLKISSIRQLKERITHEFNLSPLTDAEIHNYLNFRMREVGYTGPELIDLRIAKLIGKYSGGLLRRTNIIADKVLLSAFAESTHSITAKHVKAAVKDSGFDRSVDGKPISNSSFVIGFLILLLIIILAGGWYWFNLMQHTQQLPIMQQPQSNAATKSTVQQQTSNLLLEKKQVIISREASAEIHQDVVKQTIAPERNLVVKSEEAIKAPELQTLALPEEEVKSSDSQLVQNNAKQTTFNIEHSLNNKKKKLIQQATQVEVVPEETELTPVAQHEGVENEKILSILTKTANITKQSADKDKSDAVWLAQKLKQSKDWLAQQDNRGVSIQVMMRNKSASKELARYLRQDWPLPLDKTYLYEVDANGRQIFRVFYGKFLTLSEGQNQLSELPAMVRANSPYLHSIYKMKKTLL